MWRRIGAAAGPRRHSSLRRRTRNPPNAPRSTPRQTPWPQRHASASSNRQSTSSPIPTRSSPPGRRRAHRCTRRRRTESACAHQRGIQREGLSCRLLAEGHLQNESTDRFGQLVQCRLTQPTTDTWCQPLIHHYCHTHCRRPPLFSTSPQLVEPRTAGRAASTQRVKGCVIRVWGGQSVGRPPRLTGVSPGWADTTCQVRRFTSASVR